MNFTPGKVRVHISFKTEMFRGDTIIDAGQDAVVRFYTHTKGGLVQVSGPYVNQEFEGVKSVSCEVYD